METGGASGSVTTLWAGGIYQKVVKGGETTHKYHIPAKGGIVAVIDQKSGEVPKTHYIHRDYLDSIAAITDINGNVVERFHYDAFGKRRVAIKESDNGVAGPENRLTDRGYTGHC